MEGRVVTNAAQQAEPIQPRHHDVRQDQGGAHLAHRLQRLVAIGDRVHLVLIGKQPTKVFAHVSVVIRQDDHFAPCRKWGLRHGSERCLFVLFWQDHGRAWGVRQPPLRLFDIRFGSNRVGRERPFGVAGLLRQVLSPARNRHCEGAADAHRALQIHVTPVQPDQFVDEGQSDPGTFMRSGGRQSDAMEALENPLSLVVRNSDAGVLNLQCHGVVHGFQRNCYLALERELESVGKQVQHYVFPQVTIDEDWVPEGLAIHVKPQAGCLHRRTELAGDVRSEGRQIGRLIDRLHASGFET